MSGFSIGDDARVAYHRTCALRSYFTVLVGTCIFVDKSGLMSTLSILNNSLTWRGFMSTFK